MTPRPLRVLVVDDERISRQTTLRQLEASGYVAKSAENAYAAFDSLAEGPWDVVLTDLRMPGVDGIDLLKRVKADFPGVAVILMTAYGTVQTAVTAMLGGAADYLTKPFSFAELDFRLRRLKQLADSESELAHLRALVGGPSATFGILGRCAAIRQVRERIELFARSDAPVLVTGETGTGKELVARAIHASGSRSTGPFVAIPCGAIPRDLAESELFGHEKGSFTGAVVRHRGCFERASGGTLLLDDVDDLPLDTQVKLLRTLQDGSFRRVGGTEDLSSDVRVVATTKIALERAVAERRFRDDLFYRLRGPEIVLPPLRQRGDDVVLLADHFLALASKKGPDSEKTLSPEVAKLLRRYPWPGNVRELARVIETAVALCRGNEILERHLPEFLSTGVDPVGQYQLLLDNESNVDLARLVQQFEDDVIDWAMGRAAGQQVRASELLGIPRTTLQSKLLRRKN